MPRREASGDSKYGIPTSIPRRKHSYSVTVLDLGDRQN